MRFYSTRHAHTCGIDLHARTMYVCVLDATGKVLLHRDMPTDPAAFLAAIEPYREDLVVGVACIFTWYWLADLCDREGITFVLGHALYLKAIHGTKSKNDKIDAHKIAVLLAGGMMPRATPAAFFHSAAQLGRGPQSLSGTHASHRVQAHQRPVGVGPFAVAGTGVRCPARREPALRRVPRA